MEQTMVLIFSVLGALFVVLTIIGAVQLNRKRFLTGLFLYGLLPIIGESMAYSQDSGSGHFVMIAMFIVHSILTFPNNIVYTSVDVAANKLLSKISFSLLSIHLAAAAYCLCLDTNVPEQYGYYHIVIVAALIYIIIKRASNKDFSWK